MARLPKTLILSHFPAGSNNGSVRHLEALFDRFPDALVWFSIKPPLHPVPDPTVPYAHGGYLLRPHRLIHYLNFGPGAWYVARQAAVFGRRHDVRLVMAVMSGEAIVAAMPTARALGVPLALWVADDPPSVLGHHKLPAPILRFALSRFRSAMREARSHGVISTDLAALYREQFGIDSLVLYKGVDPSTCLPPPPANVGNEIVIGSVGTINSDENWLMLLAAVRRLNTLGERRYKVLHIGELPDALKGPDVECTGWVDPLHLAPLLARFDLCYLSLWFDAIYRTNSRTAFPTKVVSYMQAQRPILAFSIPDSQIVKVVKQYGCGVTCTVPSTTALAEAIERLLEPDVYRDAMAGMSRLKDAYSTDKYFQNFEAFLHRADSSDRRVS